MKKILTTAVFAMALAMVANAYEKTVSTFEDGAEEATDNFFFSEPPTEIKATPDYSKYWGLLPSETTSGKYLAVSTDTALCRNANKTGTAENVKDNFYIDMMAQFNETESAVMDEGDKLALYMNVDGMLVVVAGEGTKTFCVTDEKLTAGTWYRVIIRMIGNIYASASGVSRPGFVVSINGKNVSAAQGKYLTINGTLTPTAQEYYNARQLFPSIRNESTIQCLALTGVGSVDDIVFTDKRNADSSVEKPTEWSEVAASDVRYTVVNADGTSVANDPKTVDYSTLGTGVYSVQARADGMTATIVGDPIGVIEFTDLEAGKQKLISVPWKSADKMNVRVADMFVGAVNNDAVSFYDNGAYRTYTYTDGVWTTDDIAEAAGYTTDSVFAPGTAAFYTPSTTHDLKLVGIAQNSTEKVPEAGAGVNTWSALGSTVVTNTPVANILANVPESAKATGTSGSTAKDKIAVQQSDGSFKYYFIGSDGTLRRFPLGTPVKSTDVIFGGTGFMYLSTGKDVPSVKFGN